jgi:hypothetical protein
MRLLTAHKILIGAAVGLGAVLAWWGAAHRVWAVCAVGVLMLPAGVLYLRKLKRNPPI